MDSFSSGPFLADQRLSNRVRWQARRGAGVSNSLILGYPPEHGRPETSMTGESPAFAQSQEMTRRFRTTHFAQNGPSATPTAIRLS